MKECSKLRGCVRGQKVIGLLIPEVLEEGLSANVPFLVLKKNRWICYRF